MIAIITVFKKIINDIIEMFRENLKKRTISVALFVVFVLKKSDNKKYFKGVLHWLSRVAVSPFYWQVSWDCLRNVDICYFTVFVGGITLCLGPPVRAQPEAVWGLADWVTIIENACLDVTMHANFEWIFTLSLPLAVQFVALGTTDYVYSGGKTINLVSTLERFT